MRRCLAIGLAFLGGFPAARAALPLAGAGVGFDRVVADRIQSGPGDDHWLLLKGNVILEGPEAKILADEVFVDQDRKIAEATGNVVLGIPGAVLSGSRLIYRYEAGTGEMDEAVAFLEENGAILRAARLELLEKGKVRVEKAVFTTCSQPVPYWSFRMRRGVFDLGRYAHLRGVSFRAGRVPVFYTPFLVWPIKEDRASGFLFPEFGSSDKLGQTLSLPYYWVLGEHADITLYFDAHTRVGAALGAELAWLPTWNGRARGRGYWINDQVRRRTRYRFEWEQRQDLPRDFKLTAKLETISDFDYTTDYETDLARSSTPQTYSTVDITRNWSWYSLSLRARRHKQYFVGGTLDSRLLTGQVVNSQLPEIELRGRSQRLGRSPFYLSFESSIAGFEKRILEPPDGMPGVHSDEELETRVLNRWGRVDVNPRLSVPLVRRSWLDFQLSAGWRGTWYTHANAPDAGADLSLVSEPLFRSLWNAGFSLAGPRLQRVFPTPKWSFSPKLKHVIEPFVEYRWRPPAGVDQREIVVFDEIDSVPGELSDFRYGVRQRLFALRPPGIGRSSGVASAEDASLEAVEKEAEQEAKRSEQAEAEPEAMPRLEVTENLNPTEIASLEIYQSYSLVRDLGRVYTVLLDPETLEPRRDPLTGRVVTVTTGVRSFSPITIRGRFNPTHEQALDVAYTFDPANNVLTETQVSALMGSGERGYFQGSWYRRRPSNPAATNPTNFLRTRWGRTFSRRFSGQVDLDYNLEDGRLDHQYYLLRYSTQCCSFQLGWDRRDFVGNDRNEIRLVVDLAGIGQILDLKDSR
ncbi:MAG: LPS assembly protein LptD [Acidobacteriota bacterium]|nr:LPS assembly protein LptD [Acidobacteriota bacterium]